MTRFAIDGPTLVHIVTSQLAIHADHQLVAPSSLRSQALELLLKRVRAGELTDKDALALHERITETSRRTAWSIARERDWSTISEAENLAVARLQADALVTVDPDLLARADGIVSVAPVEALTAP
jgi:hypothetical protein